MLWNPPRKSRSSDRRFSVRGVPASPKLLVGDSHMGLYNILQIPCFSARCPWRALSSEIFGAHGSRSRGSPLLNNSLRRTLSFPFLRCHVSLEKLTVAIWIPIIRSSVEEKIFGGSVSRDTQPNCSDSFTPSNWSFSTTFLRFCSGLPVSLSAETFVAEFAIPIQICNFSDTKGIFHCTTDLCNFLVGNFFTLCDLPFQKDLLPRITAIRRLAPRQSVVFGASEQEKTIALAGQRLFPVANTARVSSWTLSNCSPLITLPFSVLRWHCSLLELDWYTSLSFYCRNNLARALQAVGPRSNQTSTSLVAHWMDKPIKTLHCVLNFLWNSGHS